jgi:hypothetical protein
MWLAEVGLRYALPLIVGAFAASFASVCQAQTFNCQLPVPTLKDQMIQESIAR